MNYIVAYIEDPNQKGDYYGYRPTIAMKNFINDKAVINPEFAKPCLERIIPEVENWDILSPINFVSSRVINIPISRSYQKALGSLFTLNSYQQSTIDKIQRFGQASEYNNFDQEMLVSTCSSYDPWKQVETGDATAIK